MSRAVQIAGLAALVTLAWLGGELAWSVHVARPHLLVTLENVDRTVIVAGAAAGDVERSARVWESASKAQIAASTAVLGSTKSALSALQVLVSKTDAQLNGYILPSLATAVSQQNQSLLATQKGLQDELEAFRPVLANLTSASASAASAMANPAIPASLDNVQAISKALQGVAEDAHTETGLIVAQTRQAFKPKNKFLAVLQFIGGGTISAAELYYYLTH